MRHRRRLVPNLGGRRDRHDVRPVEQRGDGAPVGTGLLGHETQLNPVGAKPFEFPADARRTARHQELPPSPRAASQPAFRSTASILAVTIRVLPGRVRSSL